MKIVITGGLGFIGSALADVLVRDDNEITIIDSLIPQIHGEVPNICVPKGVRVVRMDIRNIAEHYQILEGCDVVYHLAAETGTAQSMYKIQEYVSVNELGTASLLEALAKCNRRPSKVILASSRSVYGEGAYILPDEPDNILQPKPRTKLNMEKGMWEPLSNNGRELSAVPTSESLGFAPGSVYASTKASQELLMKSASSALDFELVIFRFQNVYGEGQSLQNPYTGIISIFFNRARQGIEIPVYEDGAESRDFVHISDIIAGLVAAKDAELESGVAINLGSGYPTRVIDLANELMNAAGFRVPIRVTGQFRVGDIRHCYADLDLARKLIDFEPKVTLGEGLKRFSLWAMQEPIHKDGLESATAELRSKGLAN